LAEVIYRADVGMIERGGSPCLALKTFQSLRVFGQGFRKELQSYMPSQSRIPFPGPGCKLAACESNMGLPRGLSGLTNFLLLVDLRSGLGDAAFYEISLNLELLLRAHVHHGVERQVAW
jgi:hypothetical protein